MQFFILTCQRLIFRWFREPATENVTSPQVFTAPEVVTRNHDGGNRKRLSLWQRQYGGPNNNMAAKQSQRLYLFSFSHYILKDVDTSNCNAMISMIKATCFFIIAN